MDVTSNLLEQEIDSALSNITDIPGRISEDQAVQWVKNRLLSGQCYTWAGVALLAVNAGQENLPDFSESAKERFRDRLVYNVQPPHLYAIAVRAQHRLVNEMGRKNQAIVISGDSGSGKTFSASHVLNLLVTCGSPDMQKLPKGLRKIWTSVPILMAFGNAKTECNDNSSRFGKLIQLQYRFGNIKGAYLKTFLLEKTRVTTQGNSQRNFHVFHQILAGLQDDELASLHLSQTQKYKIIPGEIFESDNQGYNETTNALIESGMTPKELYEVHVILAAIIHLGNISFCQAPDDLLQMDIDLRNASGYSFEAACKLLGLDKEALSKLLTTSLLAPQSKHRRCTTVYRPIVSSESCQARCDSLMRLLYEKLFQWLVDFINKQIHMVDNANCTELGILDIYGFENFKRNSLEQLCINYANERLQNYFVTNFIEHAKMTLKLELEDDVSCTSSNSYEQALQVFHAPSRSLFAVLNEESMLLRHTSDIKVWEKIYANILDYKTLVPTKYNPDAPQFSVQHFAGKVCYDVKEICEKNLDKVPSELQDYVKLSTNTFVVMLIDKNMECTLKHATKKTTVINKYQSSLDTLLSTLDVADIHFIRCVKATESLEPGSVDFAYLKHQLVASGIMDLIPLNCHRYRHFPYWFKSSEFMQRYQKLFTSVPVDSLDFLRMMKENKGMRDHIKVGRLSVFVSEAGIARLEEWKQRARKAAVVRIQRAWRNYLSRKTPVVEELCGEPQILKQDDKLHPDPCEDKVNRICAPITKCFDDISNRSIFVGDGIRSRMRLSKVPIRFHTRKTCISYSYFLPASEMPQGLVDAL